MVAVASTWKSGSIRHALESLPGTLIPGLSSGIGFVLVGRHAGSEVLGLTSLAWVTANFGSSVLGLGPAHAALRTTVTEGGATLPEYRGAMLARAAAGSSAMAAISAVLLAAGREVGWPLLLGAVWMAAQTVVLFDSEVLRAEGRFGRSSALLSARALAGWTASVIGAVVTGSVGAVVVPQVAVSLAVAVCLLLARPPARPRTVVAHEVRRVGRPVGRLAVASYALGYADRYVVEGFEGPRSVGVYTLGYTLGQGALELVMTPLTNALIPRLVSEWNDGASGPERAIGTAKRAGALLLVLSALSVPAVWLADVVGLLDIISKADQFWVITALIAVATGVQGITRLAYGLLLGEGQPEAAARAYWAVVVLSAATVPAFTAAWGVTGTAAATLAGYGVLAGLMVLAVQRGAARPMKIVHAVDYFHTDVGYQEFYLALAQATAGHDVTVVTTVHRHHAISEQTADAAHGQAQLDRAGVRVVRLPARQLGHDRAWVRGIRAALADIGPDAVHCHHSFAPTTVRVAAWCARQRLPLLVDNHIQEAIAPGSTSAAGRAYYRGFRTMFGRFVRDRVGAWVANGPHEAAFLEQHMGLAAGTVALVPLGFDPDVFRFDASRRAELRAARGWAPGDLVVATTGKLHPGKRVEAVAAACRTAGARLVLAGSIDAAYLEVIQAAGGPIEVHPMLGRRELADLYLAADTVVFARLPSISIYEAAGTGARVLVGRDAFADWLHGLHAAIEPADPANLHLTAGDDGRRADRAAGAAAAFAWPVIAADFVRRYEAAAA